MEEQVLPGDTMPSSIPNYRMGTYSLKVLFIPNISPSKVLSFPFLKIMELIGL